MKHRAWFTLVLRAIGIVMLGGTISGLISFITAVVMAVMQKQATATPEWLLWGVNQLGTLLQAGFGLYLLFGARGLVKYCLASVGGCPECGYDLTGLQGDRCPECGGLIKPSADPRAVAAPGPLQPRHLLCAAQVQHQ